MRLSVRKLPALFDLIFLLITVLEIIILFFVCLTSSTLSLKDIGTVYSTIAEKLFWLYLIGIILHIVSYFKSLENSWLLFANICGIFAFLIFLILPVFFPIAMVLQWISIYNLMTHARSQQSISDSK